MKSLAPLGWAVVDSVWLGVAIAGATALVLGLLRGAPARVRGLVAGASLVLMVIAPVLTVAIGADPLTSVRLPMARAIGDRVDLGIVLRWRAAIVPTAAILWLAGLALSFVRIAGEWRRAQGLRRDASNDAGPAVTSVVADLCTRLSVDPRVDVRGSARAGVPMVLGSRRPMILLPLAAVRALRADQLRAILAHELAHVRRRDYLKNLWQMAAETLLFHHPGAHWVSRCIRTEREYCCDDVAVAVGGDAGGYARALATLEDARGECRLAVAAASGTLLDRVRRIVGVPRPTLTPVRGALVFVLASILASVVLAGATIIPPAVPLDAQMRRRMPPPPGAIVGPPPGLSLPRKSQR